MANNTLLSPLLSSRRNACDFGVDSVPPLQPMLSDHDKRVEFNPYFSFNIPRRPSEIHFPITSSDIHGRLSRSSLSLEPLSPRTFVAPNIPRGTSTLSTVSTESTDSGITGLLRYGNLRQDPRSTCQDMSGAVETQDTISAFTLGLKFGSIISDHPSRSHDPCQASDRLQLGGKPHLSMARRLEKMRTTDRGRCSARKGNANQREHHIPQRENNVLERDESSHLSERTLSPKTTGRYLRQRNIYPRGLGSVLSRTVSDGSVAGVSYIRAKRGRARGNSARTLDWENGLDLVDDAALEPHIDGLTTHDNNQAPEHIQLPQQDHVSFREDRVDMATQKPPRAETIQSPSFHTAAVHVQTHLADPACESWGSPPAITIQLDKSQDASVTPSTTICGNDEAKDHRGSAESSESEDGETRVQKAQHDVKTKDTALLKVVAMLKTREKWTGISLILHIVITIVVVSFTVNAIDIPILITHCAP